MAMKRRWVLEKDTDFNELLERCRGRVDVNKWTTEDLALVEELVMEVVQHRALVTEMRRLGVLPLVDPIAELRRRIPKAG